MPEPKETTVVEEKATPDVGEQLDTKMTELLEGKAPSESSPENKDTGKETEPTKEAGATQPKKAAEEGKGKESEEEIPKGFADHPKWKKLMEQRNEAREALAKGEVKPEGGLSKEEVDSFKKTISSPAYVRLSMKEQGFTDEAIDGKLRELGHKVETKPADDVALVAKELNIDTSRMEQKDKDYIEDVAKIARVIAGDMLGKTLPGQLKPLQDAHDKQAQNAAGNKLFSSMKESVKKEGILDFEKDVLPVINEWLDKNPEGQQGDLDKHIVAKTRELSFERLRTGKRKEGRDGAKKGLRGNAEGAARTGEMPARTGDDDKDLDAALDAKGLV